jgi:CDP-paratose synthetase
MIKKCYNNDLNINLTDGIQKRDFIYITDVIAAYDLVITHHTKHKLYFKEYEVGTGFQYSIKELVEIIHEKLSSKASLNFGYIKTNKNELMDSKADNEELLRLGWEIKYNLNEGLKETIKLYEFFK